jgi:hypothetical protein|tara:strand:- start:194 stop:496 length:303 start_codon:yes stop_codon:yes gene_type:complete
MSESVTKLIKEEDEEILRMIHDDEAIYVEGIYELDKYGNRVYDWEAMEYSFYSDMEILVSLNLQKYTKPRLSVAEIDELIESNKDILIKLKDEALENDEN